MAWTRPKVWRLTAALALGGDGASAAAADGWAMLARGPERVATAAGSAPVLGSARWVCSVEKAQNVITFVGQAGVVADAARVYAIGRVGTVYSLFAVGREDGGVEWAAPLRPVLLDSWSSPAVDEAGATVYVAVGRFVSAFDAGSGAVRWERMLDRTVVNASPLITSDRGGADRLFITDYDGFGGAGKLYCINIDAFSAGTNPFEPGQVVWSAALGGTAGNTPAYAGGVVFVSSVSDETGLSNGRVLAFDAGAVVTPAPLWVFENPQPRGFFGGVSVAAGPGGGVYAASYAFGGGQLGANLVKLDAATGALRWSVPCNRTDSIPIPLPGGLVALSTGVHGFGSAPSIELFRDEGSAATMLWDSALATWNDVNQNLVMDPGEYLLVGGWTHQPVAYPGGPSARLLTGAIPVGTGSFGACTDLYVLDLEKVPTDPAFILSHVAGAGTTPAAVNGEVYTVGAGGLYAFGAPAPHCYANCDGSTAAPVLNVNDFVCFANRFAAADSWANCDGSTVAPILNVNDFVCFANRYAGGCP